ncbi:MAG: hypothetical protein IIB56_11545 [Planctomycetes bacterium]|nr:hypothetical protein [Planctomycetota bacterium]
MDYENKWPWRVRKNKPNSNPIKPNLKRAKMDVNIYYTEVYENKRRRGLRKNKPNSNPISGKAKMNVNSLITKDYRKNNAFAVQKNKPKTNPISNAMTFWGAFLKRVASKKGQSGIIRLIFFRLLTLQEKAI